MKQTHRDPKASQAGAITSPWPPPPHDPRERDLALTVSGWEVRLFSGRMFQYFVTRGLLHLQLWHPTARISVITPSRLTCGRYEAFPIARWKASAPSYHELLALLAGVTPTPLPERALVLMLQRRLVDDIVDSACPSRERPQCV